MICNNTKIKKYLIGTIVTILIVAPFNFAYAQSRTEQMLMQTFITYNQGQLNEAYSSIQILRRSIDKNSKDYVTALYFSGLYARDKGKLIEAEKHLLEALKRNKKMPTDVWNGVTYEFLGVVRTDLGKYELALKDFINAKRYYQLQKIPEESLGSLENNFGILKLKTEDFTGAKEHYKKALSLFEKSQDGLSPQDIPSALINLGYIYYLKEDFRTSIENYKKAKDLIHQMGLVQHSNLALVNNNLGIIYHTLGQYKKAEEFYLKGLNMRADLFGKQHPEYLQSSLNLGLLYRKWQLYDKAIKRHKEAYEISKNVYGKIHPIVAKASRILGSDYLLQGEYEEAQKYLQASVDITEKILGVQHMEYARALYGLAFYFEKTKDIKSAELLYLQALEIAKKKLGDNHTDLADYNNNLAVLYKSTGQFDKAQPLLLKARSIDLAVIHKQFPFLSETERDNLWNSIKFRFEIFETFVWQRKPTNPSITKLAYNNLLNTRGILLKFNKLFASEITNTTNKNTIQLRKKWYRVRNELSNAVSLTETELESREIDLSKLISEEEMLNKQLSTSISNSSFQSRELDWSEVQENLSPNEAAIEIRRFRKYGLEWSDSIFYSVYILKNNSEVPLHVLFMNGNELEGEGYKNYKNHIQYKVSDENSYSLYWQPILNEIEGVNKIYLANDGIFHQINLNTLKNPGTDYFVIDEVDIHLVSTTSEILNANKVNPTRKKSLSIFGYPKYQLSENEFSHLNNNKVILKRSSFADLSEWLPHLKFTPLPGTLQEVELISSIAKDYEWEVDLFTGKEANEQQVTEVGNPTILHIATHGFFMRNTERQSTLDNTAVNNRPTYYEDPMLRSGLLMAGVSNFVSNGTRNGEKDGILTAYEVTAMDLNDTDLVVLSACQTGLGDVEHGEGVYGLQRAFMIAGAKSVMMSLWEVDDKATKELMTAFYSKLLKNDDKRKAFREAQAQIRLTYDNPYYWGAFVLVGE